MIQDYPAKINQWEVFEVTLDGTAEGNPYIDTTFIGMFTNDHQTIKINGFYDGDGKYKIRYMPQTVGKHSFILRGNFFEGALSGVFEVEPAKENNHGIVQVKDTYHFAYADGTPYQSIGTTAYVWHLQPTNIKKQTIQSIVEAGFNKIRFCVFPKHYIYNFKDPAQFPFVGTPMDASILTEDNFLDYWTDHSGNDFDFEVFNDIYFKNLDEAIRVLAKFNIEADLILFHPYDRWGFSNMGRENDLRYLEYMINRYASFHNVWFSLANEWDLLKKSHDDWKVLGEFVQKNDPYNHLRSIHNCLKLYDHHEDWITHCSIQRIDLYKGAEETDALRNEYQKPVVNDEIAYEGDIPHGWGNITGEEMIRRFYETVLRGGYPGHSEVFLNDENILFWSHGGPFRGESYKRMSLVKEIMAAVPGYEIAPNITEWDSVCGIPEIEKDEDIKSMYLFYYSFMRPSYRDYYIDDTTKYAVEVIDTWNMTIDQVGVYHGKFRITLPKKQYILVRLTKVEDDTPLASQEQPIKSQTTEVVEPFNDSKEENHSPFFDVEEKQEEVTFPEEPDTIETEVIQEDPFEKTTNILPIFSKQDSNVKEEPVAQSYSEHLQQIDADDAVPQTEKTTNILLIFSNKQGNDEHFVSTNIDEEISETEILQIVEDTDDEDTAELEIQHPFPEMLKEGYSDEIDEAVELQKTTQIFPIHQASQSYDDDLELPDIVMDERVNVQEEIDEDTGNWTILPIGSKESES